MKTTSVYVTGHCAIGRHHKCNLPEKCTCKCHKES